MNWIDLTFGLQALVTLVVIMDPPGATPLFLSLVSSRPIKEQRKLAWQAAMTSFIVITAFALFGQWILDYLKISLPALKGAGGLLLLLVALELLKGNANKDEATRTGNVALVPLGTPLLAGPGAIVAIMLFVQEAGRDGNSGAKSLALALAVILVHIIIGLTLMFSTKIVSVIKESGVELLARIAGLLLAAIAVEMLVSAVKEFFPGV
ncbi:MAG: MarC family protein [Actinobacteria bacterium]|jgi:multiple antibiotic resistance protein|nr:MarC family protein [Actinomycetota bacterium]